MSKVYLLLIVICGLAVFTAGSGNHARDGKCTQKDWGDKPLTLSRGVAFRRAVAKEEDGMLYERLYSRSYRSCGSKSWRKTLEGECPPSCLDYAIEYAHALFSQSGKAPTKSGTAKSCTYPDNFKHGKVSVNGNIDLGEKQAAHGSDLRFSCDTHYEVKGKSKVFCQFGQWSDEFPTCVRSSKDRCILPHHPDHGHYIFPNSTAQPGEHFEDLFLYYSCDSGYRLMGSNTVMCHQGNWTSVIPTCQKLCKLSPHVSVDYKCMIVEGNVTIGSRACGLFEPEGTVAQPRCRSPNYYHHGMLRNMHCIDGNWDYVAVCDPECGKVTPDGVPLQVGGRPAKLGELPWHAGIYDKHVKPYMQVCGGSLVSTTMVISAGHCFWNEAAGSPHPASRYAVALGKIYRPWNDPHDTSKQQFDVKEIKFTPRFRGSTTLFQEDIALVLLSTPAEYQKNVRPVCVDFDANFDRSQLDSGKKGKIAGWGLTEPNGKSSPVLRVLELPYVPINTCITNTPENFLQHITGDKFCAGYWDGGKALCRGDSGGGLAFADSDRESSVRYYLRGVASAAATSMDHCNAHTVAVFTQISRFEDFIKENLQL